LEQREESTYPLGKKLRDCWDVLRRIWRRR